MAIEFLHKPVLFDECMQMLDIKAGGIYVDGTLGGGGHSEGILSLLDGGRLIGIDRDVQALEAAGKKLAKYEGRTTFVHSNYSEIKSVLAQLGIPSIDGALLDLGVSSYQLDNPERGFSYMHDARLDMRMNTGDTKSAYDVVNTYTQEQLCRILRDYGEEKWAKRIAQFIVERRPVNTTFELNEAVRAAIPKGARKEGGHPSKRTFQAIRIEVNEEIERLKKSVLDFFDVLKPGGILAIITFHSLEDRIVKDVFNDLKTGCTCDKNLPICVCGGKPRGVLINKKPITATDAELEENKRSHSAKLRGIQKI